MARNGCDRNLEKIGGTENPEGAPLRPGSPRAMRERERQSPGRFRADARQGNQTGDLVPMRSSRSLGGATPKKGEALRRGNASAGMGDRKTGRRCGAWDDKRKFPAAWLKAGKGPRLPSRAFGRDVGVRGMGGSPGHRGVGVEVEATVDGSGRVLTKTRRQRTNDSTKTQTQTGRGGNRRTV